MNEEFKEGQGSDDEVSLLVTAEKLKRMNIDPLVVGARAFVVSYLQPQKFSNVAVFFFGSAGCGDDDFTIGAGFGVASMKVRSGIVNAITPKRIAARAKVGSGDGFPPLRRGRCQPNN